MRSTDSARGEPCDMRMRKVSTLAWIVVPALAAAAVAAGLVAVGLWNYLIFHVLAEGFSILVAFGIFLVAWNARHRMDSGYLLTLGVAFLFVGCLDFIHTIVFPGMGILPAIGTEAPAQLWVAARAMQALSLLGALAFISRRPRFAPILAGYTAALLLVLLAVFEWKVFPSCLPKGGQLTPFKKVSELVIIGILGAALAILVRRRDRFEGGVYRCVAWAVGISMLSELAFMLYRDPQDLFNMAGHLLKLGAFYLIYRAIIRTGFQRPLELLFRDLERSRQELQAAREGLEVRVRERTADLGRTVETLRGEVATRMRAESRLRATAALLELFARKAARKEYLQAAVDLLREVSGCRCVGVRICNDRGEVPYEACAGFSEEFQLRESGLRLGRDECVCTRVIQGRPAPQDAPAMTAGGSFASGDAFSFVAALTEDQKQSYRGACLQAGFATVVVVPVRYGPRTLGAVHMADERSGLAAPEVVSFVEESMAPLIGEAVYRFQVEHALSQERLKLFSVMNILPGFVALKGADRRVRFANHKFLELFSVPGDRPCHLVQRGRTGPCEDCQLDRVLRTRRPWDGDQVYANRRVFHVWAYPFTDTDGTELVLELGLDVTGRRELEKQVIETSEAERRRIGRDLHDSLGQRLTGLAFLVEGLVRSLRGPAVPNGGTPDQILALVKDSILEVRAIAKGLDPVGLGGGGFVAGLAELAANTERFYGIQCRFRCDEAAAVEDEMVATHLYYVALEAVGNAMRHGRAGQIDIVLEKEDEGITLWVKDNGTGITPAAVEAADGMGMRTMRYRANAVGGTFRVAPGPNGGTVVRCHVPGQRTGPETGTDL